MNGKIHDVTLPFSAAVPVWPGDPAIEIRPLARIAQGDAGNTSQIVSPTHAGTHVDPPWHFFDDGLKLDQIPIERWVGPCQVIHVPEDVTLIEPGHLELASIHAGTTRLLIRTRSSTRWSSQPTTFDIDFPALSMASVTWVIKRGIELIGIDSLSFEPFEGTGGDVHRAVLGAGIVAIEGLMLAGIEPGFYDLVCLPLKLRDGDGAPARVILIEHERD